MANKPRSIFDEFTRKYALSKTLRFELKPLPATREFLEMDTQENEKLFPKDKEKAENYKSLKYYLDLLHRDFINKSLIVFKNKDKSIDFENSYKKWAKEVSDEDDNVSENEGGKKKKDALASERSVIVKSFEEKESLFGKEVIDRLEEKFEQRGEDIFIKNNESRKQISDPEVPRILFINTESETETIFQNFRGFTGYLGGYHENRKNLYKDDGKAGRVATRIIDQNLPRFFENKDKLISTLKNYSSLEGTFNNSNAWEDYLEEKKLHTRKDIMRP